LCWDSAGFVLRLRWDCVGTVLELCWDCPGHQTLCNPALTAV
jgi:hypothetical protein